MGPYRNDYAISIAYNLLSLEHYILDPLFTLPSQFTIEDVREDGTLVHNADGEIAYIKNTNVHFLNKKTILDNSDRIEELYA